MTGQDGLSSSSVETIAGFTAGIISTLCLHPLDLIKTRLQGKSLLRAVQLRYVPPCLQYKLIHFFIHRTVDRSSPRPGASFRVIRRIFQSEGGIAPFYRGLAPNIIGNSSSWALYFLFYGNLKDGMRKLRSSREQELAASDFFLASGAAGMKDTDWAHGQRSAPFPFPLI